jgi:hypothetical protein
MISVRFGEALEKRVQQAAEARGMTVSAFVRGAVEREVRAKSVSLADRLRGIAGSLNSSKVGGKKSRVADKDRRSQAIADELWEAHTQMSAAWAKRRAERTAARVGKSRRTGRVSR